MPNKRWMAVELAWVAGWLGLTFAPWITTGWLWLLLLVVYMPGVVALDFKAFPSRPKP